MRFVIFTHSLVSDWNHGNAHFLRGVASELLIRGHQLDIFEPFDGWSRKNLIREHGEPAIDAFHNRYPHLRSNIYDEQSLDLDSMLRGADVVIVHEWNSARIVSRIGQHRVRHDYQLFFHDTHHRSLTDQAAMQAYDLRHFDGVLAYGNVIREAYLAHGWTTNAFTWHEAADTRVFRPIQNSEKLGDLVWIGNWGDGERVESLREFLIEPVRNLGLTARVYGVRYPNEALAELDSAGIEYAGWLPNYEAPEVFSRYRVTLHVPRRPYVEALPGIPTIRPFEALACGIPLISAPWNDAEHLFHPGKDFLFVKDGSEMTAALQLLIDNTELANSLASSGLRTIEERHTCAHRVDELFTFMQTPSAVLTQEGC